MENFIFCAVRSTDQHKQVFILSAGYDIKVTAKNEIKEHLKNETTKSDQSVTDSYLK